MIHRITIKSNPKLLVLFLGLFVLLVAGVLALIFIGVLLGIIAIAVVGLIGYYMVKNTVYHLRSKIESSDTGLGFTFPGDQEQMFRWKDITYAAYCIRGKGTPFITVYKEKEDQLMSIPREFEGFDHLLQELRRHIKDVPTLELEKKELIEDKLKVVLGMQDGTDDTAG